MAHRRLRSPGQPLPLRCLLGAYEFLASLQLAVALIAALTVVLVWSAFDLDRRYGTRVVQFAVYNSWWFALLNFLLGVNVLCAALVRFPWRKRQAGFLITHAGILVLLVGCLATRQRGIDAQLPIFEGNRARLAFRDTQHVLLTVYPQDGSPAEAWRIPFAAGPFNWGDYATLAWFPWGLVRRDQGVLCDEQDERGAIRLEVLDYYSNSFLFHGPELKLRVRDAPATGEPASASLAPWQTVALRPRTIGDPHDPQRRMIVWPRQALAGGGDVLFRVAGSQAETAAFLDSRPEGPLGKHGQLVLHAGGKKFVIGMHQFQIRSRQPLGDTGLEVELMALDAGSQTAVLRVHCPGEEPQRMMLSCLAPEFDQQDEEHGVFGVYWAPEADPPEADPAKRPAPESPPAGLRIDILQGADQQLYYRVWRRPKVEPIEPLPGDGASVTLSRPTGRPLTFCLEEFTPHDRPGQRIEPAPFTKDRTAAPRQVRLRLTVDGNTEEFWLEGSPMIIEDADPAQRKVVCGNGRRVAVSLPWDRVDVGFWVYLHKAERRLDPGSSMPSHYSSLVDFLDPDDPDQPLQQQVVIALNAPAEATDPRTGRSYRLFQEDYKGPWKPGEDWMPGVKPFDRYAGPDSRREDLALSVLSVNYDPGRGLKYAGSLLITVGVAVVFYLRAHLLRRRGGEPDPKE